MARHIVIQSAGWLSWFFFFKQKTAYEIQLRSLNIKKKQELAESKSWTKPVRVFARHDDWINENGTLTGSHDEQGQVRPQYIADRSLYETDGTVKKEYLDPDCIEYNDFNLSAGRYKPFTLAKVGYDPPAKIIRELQALEKQIQQGLDTLLAMVEGEE